MIAVIVNMGAVLLGSLLGILLKNQLKEKIQRALMAALALCTFALGMMNALKTENILCVLICMPLGAAIGELLHIDDGINYLGDLAKNKAFRGLAGESRFTEGFVSASILFCVGSMTVMGSLQAGIHHDYSIIYTKSALDFVSSMAFSAAMGIGVAFSALFILVFQGGLTLLASVAGPLLDASTVTEMSAVGGVILIGMAINMLELGPRRIKAANMLPAIFLPILYFPIQTWLSGLFS